MTNSEYPDQTAPQGAVCSGSSQFCQYDVIPREKYINMVSEG